jgi:GDPmannose 4,6-dehydratase
MKTAFITGIFGQDGRHLTRVLLGRGYKVCGFVRNDSPVDPLWLEEDVQIFRGDITDYPSVCNALNFSQPNEVYHLAAMTFVPQSWATPIRMMEVNTLGTLNLLESVRQICPESRVLFACSSEAFGNVPAPQSEDSPMKPSSVYGLTKLDGYHLCRFYRDHHGLYVAVAISFNHESPIRPTRFVTRKITNGLARIMTGKQKKISLGALDSHRDWGYALDFTMAMNDMLQLQNPEVIVLGTGWTHSVSHFTDLALNYFGLDWHVVEEDELLKRPEDIHELRADCSKAKSLLNWDPMGVNNLVKMMCRYDYEFEMGKNPDWIPELVGVNHA